MQVSNIDISPSRIKIVWTIGVRVRVLRDKTKIKEVILRTNQILAIEILKVKEGGLPTPDILWN